MSRPRRALLAAVTVVFVLGGSLGTAVAWSAGEILKGVTAAGIPVSGLTARQAVDKLTTAAKAVERRQVKLVIGKRHWSSSALDLGIRVDLNATVRTALKAGRHDPVSWVRHVFGEGHIDIPWEPVVDTAKLDASLDELSKQVRVQASDAKVAFYGAQVMVSAPTEGIDLSVKATRQQLIDEVLKPRNNLALSVTITSPSIDNSDVQRIEQQARTVLATPAVFVFQATSFTLGPEAISRVLRVRLIEDPEAAENASLVLQVDADALRDEVVLAAPWAHRPARDASFRIAGDHVMLVPSEQGSTVDATPAAFALLDPNKKEIFLQAKLLAPNFTTEHAQALGIVSKISSFTTFFDPRNAPRVANIDLMADAISGTIMKPGDAFSLNGATGPRTPQNGYQEASIIVNGELVPGIGGGVCQVATTLFNAVFTAGLEITERTNHSLYISKYPIGRDATVNYGSQDLKFRNDTKYGLLLHARVTKKAMVVDFYSSPLGRRVEQAAGEQFNPKPPETKYIDDAGLPAGHQVVVEEGAPGFDIRVIRTVFEEDRVLHRDTLLSKYRPWKRIIRRGTGPSQGG